MANVNCRERKSGRRWTAVYVDAQGRRRSAGTFDSAERAMTVALAREGQARGAIGAHVDEAYKATVTIAEFAEVFLRLHQVEPTTKAQYHSALNKHLLPTIGSIRVCELTKSHVRELFARNREICSPTTQKLIKYVLSAMMTMAVADGYRDDHPVRFLKTARLSTKNITVLIPEQYEAIYKNLPTDGSRVLSYLLVSTGLRTGEAAALTVADLDNENILHVNKTISYCGIRFSPVEGQPMYVKSYTKDGGSRTVDLDDVTSEMVRAWAAKHNLGPNDRLFPAHLIVPRRPVSRKKYRDPLTPERLAALGNFVGPNGCTYNHGTINGAVAGKCKCDACKQAASEYSYARKKKRSTPVKAAGPKFDGLSRSMWRQVWLAAVEEANIPFTPTAYQLRHTHASWLVERGVDVQTVCDRLGHKDLTVTSRYVHRVHRGRVASKAMIGLLNVDHPVDGTPRT